MSSNIRTYSTAEGCNRMGFAIRDQSRITRTERPHRHEFFQMRVDLSGEVQHHIGTRRRTSTTRARSGLPTWRGPPAFPQLR